MAAKSPMGFLLLLLVATSVNISAAQTSHLVGEGLGWTIPPGGAITYATWAATKTFAVLDKLVFNFTSGAHNVAEVSKADFDACTTATPISLHATSPATVTLSTQGEHYFICNFTSHCSFGQKLAINVTAASSSPSPSPSPQVQPEAPASAPVPQPHSPTPAPAPVPSSAPVIHIVRGLLGWGIPANSSLTSYQLWAANNTFKVGDILVFNYINQTHSVAQVTKEHLGTCNTTSPLFFSSNPPTSVTLTTPGEYFFTCTFPRHCSLGQQLAINVSGTATPSPSPSPTPTHTPTPTPTPSSSPSSTPGTVVPSTPTPTSTVATPPAGSSATSLGVTGFSTVLFSIAVALFY